MLQYISKWRRSTLGSLCAGGYVKPPADSASWHKMTDVWRFAIRCHSPFQTQLAFGNFKWSQCFEYLLVLVTKSWPRSSWVPTTGVLDASFWFVGFSWLFGILAVILIQVRSRATEINATAPCHQMRLFFAASLVCPSVTRWEGGKCIVSDVAVCVSTWKTSRTLCKVWRAHEDSFSWNHQSCEGETEQYLNTLATTVCPLEF